MPDEKDQKMPHTKRSADSGKAEEKRSRGAQPKFDQEAIIPVILDEISKGKPLAKVCERDDFPTPGAVMLWAEKSPTFARDLARAREIGFDAIAADALKIADDGSNDTYVDEKGNVKVDNDAIQRSRLRVETRLKLLACWSARYRPDSAATSVTVNTNVGVVLTEADRLALVKERREALTSRGAGSGRVIEAPPAPGC